MTVETSELTANGANPWSRRRVSLPPAVQSIVPALCIVALQQVFFPAPAGVLVKGVIVGGLSALLALGMALVYRANHIVNFAQADLGAVPATLAVFLISSTGLNYVLGLTLGIGGAIVLGAVVELAIVRRFFRAPRLLLTVATIGIAQISAAMAVLLAHRWYSKSTIYHVNPPFHFIWNVSPLRFDANDFLALVVAPTLIITVSLLLLRTKAGVAIRGSAESADRASLLGIPVKRLQTVVWTVATLLAFAATFLQASIGNLPLGEDLTFPVLLAALAALVLGKLDDLPAVAVSAYALGLLRFGVVWNHWRFLPNPGTGNALELVDPIFGILIVVTLLLRRRGTGRLEATATSSWQAAEEVRPIPPELARVPLVRWSRIGLGVLIVGVALALPNFLDTAHSLKASAVLLFAILGISLVVLTGWAGQISLGQVALFQVGAVVGALATGPWHLDLTLAALVSAAAGAAVATVVGLPALRLRGLYLAVVTLAFALAANEVLLNHAFFSWIPVDRVERKPIFGRISYDSPTRIYYVALAGLALVILAVRGIRHSRTGRVLIALRENERATQAYGVSVARAKLTAFAISGAIAGFGGCLFVHHQQAIDPNTFSPGQNLAVLTMVVIGGIGSVPGAVIGALYLRGTLWFLPADWQFLASGAGVLFVLVVLPSGLGGLIARARDQLLRLVASRRGILVPSLLADAKPAEVPLPQAKPDPVLTTTGVT